MGLKWVYGSVKHTLIQVHLRFHVDRVILGVVSVAFGVEEAAGG